jgi:hypothetical protein
MPSRPLAADLVHLCDERERLVRRRVERGAIRSPLGAQSSLTRRPSNRSASAARPVVVDRRSRER